MPNSTALWDSRASLVTGAVNSHPWGEAPCAPAVAVELLGDIRFSHERGVAIEPPSSAQRRLLALLALRSRGCTGPDQLADLLGVAPGTVHTAMSRLRRTLGSDTVLTESYGYRLMGVVDVFEVEQLARDHSSNDRLATIEVALSMWHGEALREFRSEPWACAEAARLDELHAHLSDELAGLLIARGRGAEAVVSLAPRVINHPLRDRTQGLLILALAAEGRRAEALRIYQKYRMMLIDDLGVQPSRWIQDVERRVATDAENILTLIA